MKRSLQRLSAHLIAFRERFARADVLLDLHIYGGLLVAAVGGWHIHKAWTGVSLGLALVAIGLWGSRPRGVG